MTIRPNHIPEPARQALGIVRPYQPLAAAARNQAADGGGKTLAWDGARGLGHSGTDYTRSAEGTTHK
jgi:hypothetical protein